VMIESVQGEGGVNPATPSFMLVLRALTRDQGLLLIADEIQTRVGRLGTLYGCQSFPDADGAVLPDIMTFGKGLGGGVPIDALVARGEVSVFDHGDQGEPSTATPSCAPSGWPCCPRWPGPPSSPASRRWAAIWGERLTALSAELGLGPERGMGLLRALELGSNMAADVVAAARGDGLLLNAPRPAVLRVHAVAHCVEERDRPDDRGAPRSRRSRAAHRGLCGLTADSARPLVGDASGPGAGQPQRPMFGHVQYHPCLASGSSHHFP
jgi:acetylornithine/N-succinyldiaminopimelate aminotransferase